MRALKAAVFNRCCFCFRALFPAAAGGPSLQHASVLCTWKACQEWSAEVLHVHLIALPPNTDTLCERMKEPLIGV